MATRVIDRLVTEVLFRGGVQQLTAIETKLASTRTQLDSFSRATAKFGALFLGATVPIVRRTLSVSQATQRLSAITGATEAEMTAMREEALRVGADLPLMTAEILNAQEAWARLGNDISGVVDVTETLSQAAVAGGSSPDSLAKIANAARLQFQLTNAEVNLLLDQLARIEAISPGTALSVGEAFRFSGQGAADAGLAIEEYISLLGVGAGSGRAPGEFSRGLTQAFTRISRALSGHGRSAKLITESFKLIGFDLDEVRQILDQPFGFTALFGEIGKRTQETDPFKVKAALGSIFGVEYVDVFTFLARQHEKLLWTTDEIANAQGEAARQAGEMMKGMYGAWQRFKALLDNIFIRIGEARLDQAFESLTRAIGDFMDHLLQVDSQGNLVYGNVFRWIGTTLQWGTSLLFVAAAAKGLSLTLGLLGGGVTALRWVMQGLGKVSGVIVAVFSKLLHPFRTLGGFFATMGTRIGLFGVALAPLLKILLPLVAVGLLLWAAWKPISTFFRGVWKGLTEGADQIGAAFGRLWAAVKPVGAALAAVFGWDVDATGEGIAFGKWIVDTIVTIIDSVTAFVEWITGLSLFDAGAKFIGGFLNGILSVAGKLIEAVAWVFGQIGELLPASDARAGPFKNLTDAGRSLVRTFTRGVQSAGGLESVLAGGPLHLVPPVTVGPPPIRPSAVGRSAVTNIGPTTIQVIGGNASAEEIAREVDRRWNRRMREAVEQADSPVAS